MELSSGTAIVTGAAGGIGAEVARRLAAPHPRRVINATGVVLHTNLGRALLCDDALENIRTIAGSYSNLEFNIKTGKRGIRYQVVEELICELTGAQGAIVVNKSTVPVGTNREVARIIAETAPQAEFGIADLQIFADVGGKDGQNLPVEQAHHHLVIHVEVRLQCLGLTTDELLEGVLRPPLTLVEMPLALPHVGAAAVDQP